VETRHPGSWWDLEDSCTSSLGHLVSVEDQDTEHSLVSATGGLHSFWSGGNMCPDSPAPVDSLWSSGADHLTYTNFATDSLLDSRRCCIKVEKENANVSSWMGEDCQSILKGVCQFHVEKYLDSMVNASSSSSSPTSSTLTWTTEGILWQPDNFFAEICHTRRLSPSALPVEDEDKCHERNDLNLEGPPYVLHLDHLLAFSEYRVRITAKLANMSATSAIDVAARTRNW